MDEQRAVAAEVVYLRADFEREKTIYHEDDTDDGVEPYGRVAR